MNHRAEARSVPLGQDLREICRPRFLLLRGLWRAGGVPCCPTSGLSLMNRSVCDHHFFPWECNDDVISRAQLWVCEYQTHDPSSAVNCLGEGINLVLCNIEKRFVGLQQGACRQADDLARPGGSGSSAHRACILIAASIGGCFLKCFCTAFTSTWSCCREEMGVGTLSSGVSSFLIRSAIMR